jgi:hypothetical protein
MGKSMGLIKWNYNLWFGSYTISVLQCKEPRHCIEIWKLINQGDSWPGTSASSAVSNGGNVTPSSWQCYVRLC